MAFQLRHPRQRGFERRFQRRLHRQRNAVANLRKRGHQLVRRGTNLRHRRFVRQPRRNRLGHAIDLERTLAGQRVEVHPQRLPAHALRHHRPLLGREVEGGQPFEGHIGQGPRTVRLPCLERRDLRRQGGDVVRLANQPAIERAPLGRGRGRVDHLDDVREARVIAGRRLHQLAGRGILEPFAHQPLGPRAERSPPHLARTHDLHEGAQHAAVVDHAAEHRDHEVRLHDREQRGKQRRHVLHRARLPRIDRALGDPQRIDRTRRFERLGQLRFGVGIEAVRQRAGGGELRKQGFGSIGIGDPACLVDRVGPRQEARQRRGKERLVGHRPTPL